MRPSLLLLVTLPLLGHVTGSDVTARAAAAEDEVARLQTLVDQLLARADQLSSTLSALNADLVHKSDQLTALNGQVSQQHGQIRNLTSALSHNTKTQDTLHSFCHSHVSGLAHRVAVLEQPIAFTAQFTNDSVGNQVVQAGRSQHLVFDLVKHQTGGDNYNKTTGIFTAPTTGTYAFFVTVQRNNPDEDMCLEASVMKNSYSLITTATACPPGFSAASNTGVTWLRAGDKVYVATKNSGSVLGFVHTTFSGMKLTSK
ncbi:uncharacterized protein LOC143284309 [Babylonia areolata]|uniref:uncharacterized protein LOC143284309 n=1 Tax=Babylonia areolata TaxID=304850 RepID=UPI003FD10648